jgi:hypothetical protein
MKRDEPLGSDEPDPDRPIKKPRGISEGQWPQPEELHEPMPPPPEQLHEPMEISTQGDASLRWYRSRE